MGSFGENLRREREMRGISLEEISATTKISVRLLDALENDDFANLPGGIFTRGFIRSYAKYLGIDEEHVMSEYQLLVQPKTEMDIPRSALGRLGTSKPTKRSPTLPLLIAFVLLVGGYALYRYSHRSAEPGVFSSTMTAVPNSDSAKPEGGPSPASQPTNADQSPPASAAGLTNGASPSTGTVMPGEPGSDRAFDVPSGANQTAGIAPNGPGGSVNGPPASAVNESTAGAPSVAIGQANPVIGQGNLVLQLAATESTWIEVDADGKTELTKTLKAKEIRTVRAKGSFDVTTGNASGLVLTLNGETLPPVGKRGEVKKVHLTANDLKPLAPQSPAAIPQN